MSQWQGTQAEKDLADAESAPWVVAVHMDNADVQRTAGTKMSLLRNAGYKGWYVVENHSNGQNEYAMTGIQVAQVREVLQSGAPHAARSASLTVSSTEECRNAFGTWKFGSPLGRQMY